MIIEITKKWIQFRFGKFSIYLSVGLWFTFEYVRDKQQRTLSIPFINLVWWHYV